MTTSTLRQSAALQRLMVSLRTVEKLALMLGGLVWLTVLISFHLSESLDLAGFWELLFWSSAVVVALILPVGLLVALARARALGTENRWENVFDTAVELRLCYFSINVDAGQRWWCLVCACLLLVLFSLSSVLLANGLFFLFLY